MKPKEVLEKWIDCFNKADAYHIAELYATNAVNHQSSNNRSSTSTSSRENCRN